MVEDGYRFIQGILPVKMHKEFTALSRKQGQPRSELLRRAIEAFLKDANKIRKGGRKNESGGK